MPSLWCTKLASLLPSLDGIWSWEEVKDGTMRRPILYLRYCEFICHGCVQAAKEYDTHLQAGANIAGFLKVADAMLAHGVF